MKLKLTGVILLISLPMLSYANDVTTFTWKATYYNAIPNNHEVNQTYCKQHEPGTFVGIVNDQLSYGAITDRHIKLSHFTFKQHIKHGIYFMKGSVLASGITQGKKWRESIQYYVYKLTEDGVTRGVWSSQKCKGLYLGRLKRK